MGGPAHLASADSRVSQQSQPRIRRLCLCCGRSDHMQWTRGRWRCAGWAAEATASCLLAIDDGLDPIRLCKAVLVVVEEVCEQHHMRAVLVCKLLQLLLQTFLELLPRLLVTNCLDDNDLHRCADARRCCRPLPPGMHTVRAAVARGVPRPWSTRGNQGLTKLPRKPVSRRHKARQALLSNLLACVEDAMPA